MDLSRVMCFWCYEMGHYVSQNNYCYFNVYNDVFGGTPKSTNSSYYATVGCYDIFHNFLVPSNDAPLYNDDILWGVLDVKRSFATITCTIFWIWAPWALSFLQRSAWAFTKEIKRDWTVSHLEPSLFHQGVWSTNIRIGSQLSHCDTILEICIKH